MNPTKKFIARKQELFSKITELINAEGYENITIRGICKNLDISTGTFYHYFSEKGDLAWALFSDIDDFFSNEVLSQFKEDEVENLKLFCTCYGKYNIRNGVETSRCINMAPLKNNSVNYLDENRKIFKVLKDLLIRGVEKKQFNSSIDPEETARMLMVLLRGYSSDWAKHDGNYDLVSSIEKFIVLFSKSLTLNPQ